MLATGLAIYFRNQGICTLEEAKLERQKVVNTTLVLFTATILVYLVGNYFILEIVGIAVGLPWAESAFWN